MADAFTETFSYTGPGEVTAKQWGVVRDYPYTNEQGVLTHTTAGFTLSQSYTWDGEGRKSTTDVTTGQAMSVYTVVTNKSGELVTAFPGRPTR